MFIITKLDVNKLYVENEGTFDSQEIALSKLFNKLKTQQDLLYVNKINDKQHILVYKIIKGYFTNSKELSHIYQIIEFKKPEDKKEYDSDDDEI